MSSVEIDIEKLGPKSPDEVEEDWYTRIFDERYLEIDLKRKPEWLTRRDLAWIDSQVDLSRPKRILDLACGYGRHAVELARRGHEVVGIDLSEVLLNAAGLRAKRAGVHVDLRHGDMRSLPDERFDAILLMDTSFGYLPERAENLDILRSCRELLALSGGRLLVQQLRASDRLALARHASETLMLADGTVYRKISRVDARSASWYGAYVYWSDSDVGIVPYRIHMDLPDDERMQGGARAFASGV